jgi:hypothetical protein
MRGVIDFHVFAEVEALDEDICLEAIATSVPGLDREKLRAISCRHVDDQTFFGDWYDTNQGVLIKRGTWRTEDGRTLENPVLTDLEGLRISSGAFEHPGLGSGGQFAYAFVNPPYGLGASPKEVQRVFEGVRRFLLPPDTVHEILDWSDPRLPEAAEYFKAGMDWWGVFLFVVFVPDHQRLVVISASTTD